MHKLGQGLLFIVLVSINTLIANDIEQGATLYKKCVACHGFKGEKYALGKSAAINGMTKEQIIMSMEGYQTGSDEGMRALMKGEVKHLSKRQIENLAAYVVTLKQRRLEALPVQVQPDTIPEKYVPDSFKMKIKTKRYAKDVAKVKALIAHDALTKREAKRKGIKQFYLTRIVFKEDEKKILEIKSTPYLSKNIVLKFTYKSYGGEKLHVQAYNNLGKSATQSAVIKDDTRAKKPLVLDSDRQSKIIVSHNDKAIYDYFGDINLIPSNKIQLIAPYIASNAVAVPVNVRSTIKAKRVTLFASEEDNTSKMIVEWILHKQTLVDFGVKIKLDNYANYGVNTISVVIEGEDGKFYVANIKVSVAIGREN